MWDCFINGFMCRRYLMTMILEKQILVIRKMVCLLNCISLFVDEGTFVIPSLTREMGDACDLIFSSAITENKDTSLVADVNEETGLESFHTIGRIASVLLFIEERKGEDRNLAFFDPAICDISEMPETIEEKPVKEEVPYVREFVYVLAIQIIHSIGTS